MNKSIWDEDKNNYESTWGYGYDYYERPKCNRCGKILYSVLERHFCPIFCDKFDFLKDLNKT